MYVCMPGNIATLHKSCSSYSMKSDKVILGRNPTSFRQRIGLFVFKVWIRPKIKKMSRMDKAGCLYKTDHKRQYICPLKYKTVF